MKQIALFIGSLGFAFVTLTFALLAVGQFFTPILAAIFICSCGVLSIIFIDEALK